MRTLEGLPLLPSGMQQVWFKGHMQDIDGLRMHLMPQCNQGFRNTAYLHYNILLHRTRH